MNECEKQATKISWFILYYIVRQWHHSFIIREQTDIYNYGRYVYKADTSDIYENTRRSVQEFLGRKIIILATSLITAIRGLAFESKSLRPKAGWAGILTSRHAVSNIPSDSLSSPHQLQSSLISISSRRRETGRNSSSPHYTVRIPTYPSKLNPRLPP